jgi:NTE family protein
LRRCPVSSTAAKNNAPANTTALADAAVIHRQPWCGFDMPLPPSGQHLYPARPRAIGPKSNFCFSPRLNRNIRVIWCRRSPALVVLFLCLAGSPVEAGDRPRIGVAFSGGGARGIAHIGVLRVLEELRIPIDYIAGASMGAIIGGLYASGMTPDELERAVLAVDWNDTFRDRPSRERLSFRRKNDDLRYIPDLEVGIGRGGLRYPTGLRSGQKLNFLLRRLTLPVRSVRDFDALPIPFRAVATDISNGEMVVLRQGDLARALRASMALPAAFSAIEIDGRVLVDGGVANNLPVDVVRSLGADVVIAIDVGEPMLTTEQVRSSLFKILAQTLGMITRANVKPQREQADLVIAPDVAGFGTLSFDRAPEILQRGREGARAMAAGLARFSLSAAEYRSWREARRRAALPPPIVSAVRFAGDTRVDPRVLQGLVRLPPGRPLDLAVAADDLDRLFGLGDFEAVDFDLADDPGGGAVAVYRLHDKAWGPNYLRAGLELDTDADGRNDLGVLAKLNVTRLNRRGAEWTTALQLGGDRYVKSELYQPFTFETGWFAAVNVAYENRLTGIFEDGRKLADLEVREQTVGADLGYTFAEKGEMRLGAARRWALARAKAGELPAGADPFLDRTLDLGGVVFSAVVDRLDNAKIPQRGGLFRLTAFRSVASLGAEAEYTKVSVRLSKYFTRGRHTLFGMLDGGFSPGSELPLFDEFAFGGLFSLSGFAKGELRGQSFGIARLGYLHRLGRILYAGGYVEAGRAALTSSDLVGNPILAVTAVAACDTPIGPAYLGYGQADDGERQLYLLFGRSF